ncbi:hypothetical protein ACIQU5_31360 [Streptomyces sp. NPDC090306]|uniref:hypothetical protein n=1 Tax=Streptomyces sp. NPDC090306 TaxID=3365961 RepID=UPI003828325D
MPHDPYAVLRALLRAEASRATAEPDARTPRPPAGTVSPDGRPAPTPTPPAATATPEVPVAGREQDGG